MLNSSLVSDIYVGDDGNLHKVIGGADTVLNSSNSPITVGDVFKLYIHTHSDKSSKGVITHYGEAILYINGTVFMSANISPTVTMEYHDLSATSTKTVS